jgi:hypothetical protein
LWVAAAVGLGCGDGGDAVDPDATAGSTVDSGPAPTCGCEDTPVGETCVSARVFEWVDRSPVGPDDGLTVHLVTEIDYDSHAAPLAVAVPDVDGRVVFSGFTPSPGLRTYVVLDDPNDAGVDAWTHTGVGPIDVPGVVECVDAPAVTRSHGDVFLTDAGYPPDEPPILGGTVILEIVDESGEFRDLIGVETAPIVITDYFTADRQHIDRFLTSTTESGAAFTGAATFCSPLCRNITCSCGDPTCGHQGTDRGGTGNGFLFATMECHR